MTIRKFFNPGLSVFLLLITVFIVPGCKGKKEKNDFSFVFMTDIHITPERNAVPGFSQAISTVNELKPDFVITGGDLIMDALGVSYGQADSLYNLYQETVKELHMPVYNTMGNHEIYGIYPSSGADPDNPEYGEKMFEKRLGKSYYSFEYKGWKFMILNSVEDTGKGRYVGFIDDNQMRWIIEELQKTDPAIPIVLSTHIPFLTARTQKYAGSTVASDSGTVVYNSRQVLDLFSGYNLKIVLQGHLHTLEDIYIDNIHFITGGAISANWWNGPRDGDEEGFLLVNVSGGDFSWKYIDYGWEVLR